jgi:hypothetical protein
MPNTDDELTITPLDTDAKLSEAFRTLVEAEDSRTPEALRRFRHGDALSGAEVPSPEMDG